MSFVLLGILNAQAAGSGAAGAYDLLETTVLTSDTSSVSFTGLSSYSDYKHLQVRVVAKSSAGANLQMRFNGDTGFNYTDHRLLGDGSSVNSYARVGESALNLGSVPNNSSQPFLMDILDFSSTNKNTVARVLRGHPTYNTQIALQSLLHLNTSALHTIQFTNNNFKTGSRFSIYGIK